MPSPFHVLIDIFPNFFAGGQPSPAIRVPAPVDVSKRFCSACGATSLKFGHFRHKEVAPSVPNSKSA